MIRGPYPPFSNAPESYTLCFDPGPSSGIYPIDGPSLDVVNVPATLAALVAVALFLVALVGMTLRDFRVAGFCFLSASIVIYVRETYLLAD